MKRIKSICIRGIAIILSAFILSCTVIADFEKPVYATGVEESLYYGLRALIQTVMLSQGYSYSSTSDLDISTKGLENIIESYKDNSDFSDSVALTELFTWVAGKKIGDTLDNVTDRPGVIGFVKQFIQNQMVGKSSYESSSDTSTVKTTVTHVTAVSDVMKRIDFKGLDVNLQFSSTLSKSNIFASYAVEPNLYNSTNGFSVVYFCANVSSGALVLNNNTLTLYNSSSSSPVPFYGNRLDKRYVSDTTLTSYYQNNWTYTYEKDVSYSLDLSKFSTIYSTLPVYSSYNAYVKSVENSQTYQIKNRIVGSTTNAKDISDSISVTDDSATKQVQTALESATTSGTTLTDAQLDEIAAKVIQGLSTTSTDTTDTTSDNTETNSLINNVYVSVQSLTDLLTQFKQKYIAGSEALQDDVDDLSDQFEVIEGGGDNQEDPEEDPKIWIPPGFFAISFLKPLIEYFSEPISEITKFLDKIMDSVASLPQLFDETGKLYIGNIFTNLSSITSYVGQIAQSIGSLPSAIGDVIEIPEIKPQEIVEAFNNELAWPDIKVDVPAINIPDINIPEIKLPEINFPSIPNYLDILNDILSAIQNLFVIDTAAVGDSADDLKDVWNDHLPFVPKLQNIFANLNFSSSYDYPVIKIQTPAILLPYYKKESIVLLDFKDYAYYFLWARNIVRAMLWVGFAYSIFKHFRVRFHIG